MGLIEDALRGTFESQVANPPAVDDAAGRAIASAATLRRRHTAAAALASAVCVALLTGAFAVISSARGGPGLAPAGPSQPTPSDTAPIPLAVLYDHRLTLPDRTVLQVNVPAAPTRAWQVKDGWVVETLDHETAALWFMPPAGGTPVLIVQGTAVLLSPDGGRVAWADQGRVTVANRTGPALADPREARGTGELRPIRFVGGGILLGGPTAGVAGVGYDMWFPDRGSYRAGNQYLDPILTASLDNTHLYALTNRNFPCLVMLVPDGFDPERTACDLDLSGVNGAYPAPAGQWLALTFNDRIELYDLTAIWSSAPPVQTWFTANASLTWLDGQSFVVSTGSSLVRYAADRPGRGDTYDVAPKPYEFGFVTPWVWPVPTLR